jgi:hypothetical protein
MVEKVTREREVVSLNLTGHETCEFISENGENDRAMGCAMTLVEGLFP